MMGETEIQEQINRIVNETNPDAYVVEANLRQSPSQTLIVKVDTDTGISLNECMKINRAINRWRDENEILDDTWGVEVSSPGIGEPIRVRRQYARNKGKLIRVILNDGLQEEGELVYIEDGSITLRKPIAKKKGKKSKKQRHIPKDKGIDTNIEFENIKESKVIISF